MLDRFARLTAYTVLCALMLLGSSGLTCADPVDDYIACLIGRSAVELNRQPEGHRNSEAAQNVAYKRCRKPAKLNSEEGDFSDFVNIMVVAMANQLGGN